MSVYRWLSNAAPVTIITTAAILAVSLAVMSTLVAMSGPWLGVEFDRSYDGVGVRVLKIRDNSPAIGKLNYGDIIQAMVTPLHARVDVPSLTTLDDPDQLSSYAEYNAFFALQQTVWEALSSPSFTAILSDERRIEIAPGKYASPLVLPTAFWWLLFFGCASFLLGISAWSLRRDDPVTRTLAVSGIGFMVGAYSCGIYTARELAMPSQLFTALTATNHLGIMVFAYAAILFFGYYPRRLISVPSAWICMVGVALLWLNETLQWLSWPGHVFYAHFVVAYSLLVIFGVVQWRKSKGAPLEREMLKWVLATMLLSLGFTIALYYGPVILIGKPIASEVLTFGSVFLFYLGLVVGNIRYRQFDMEFWWIRVWQWLLFMFIALIADALFLYFLHTTEATSLGLSICVGLIYLIVRQWFWSVISGNNSKAFERVLPHLVSSLIYQPQKTTPVMRWQQLISSVFNPLSVKTLASKCNTVVIVNNGVTLQLPDLDGVATIEAICCDKGNRLFTATDVYIANRLLELMRQSSDIHTAREQGVQEERHRIQRDLHDDVAARLLSLLHQTHEPLISKVAQNALRGLRDVIHLLGAEDDSLTDVMTDIEAGAREQLAGLRVHFKWHSPDRWPAVMLNSQQHINLRRIAREAIANALKHAHPENIIFDTYFENSELCLSISNDGVITEPGTWIANRGLNNIKSRVVEMAGSHKWVIELTIANTRYCSLTVCVPIAFGEKLETNTTHRRL